MAASRSARLYVTSGGAMQVAVVESMNVASDGTPLKMQ